MPFPHALTSSSDIGVATGTLQSAPRSSKKQPPLPRHRQPVACARLTSASGRARFSQGLQDRSHASEKHCLLELQEQQGSRSPSIATSPHHHFAPDPRHEQSIAARAFLFDAGVEKEQHIPRVRAAARRQSKASNAHQRRTPSRESKIQRTRRNGGCHSRRWAHAFLAASRDTAGDVLGGSICQVCPLRCFRSHGAKERFTCPLHPRVWFLSLRQRRCPFNCCFTPNRVQCFAPA